MFAVCVWQERRLGGRSSRQPNTTDVAPPKTKALAIGRDLVAQNAESQAKLAEAKQQIRAMGQRYSWLEQDLLNLKDSVGAGGESPAAGAPAAAAAATGGKGSGGEVGADWPHGQLRGARWRGKGGEGEKSEGDMVQRVVQMSRQLEEEAARWVAGGAGG
jgi:hypothetical protein